MTLTLLLFHYEFFIAVQINYKYTSADDKECWHDILHSALKNVYCKNLRNRRQISSNNTLVLHGVGFSSLMSALYSHFA